MHSTASDGLEQSLFVALFSRTTSVTVLRLFDVTMRRALHWAPFPLFVSILITAMPVPVLATTIHAGDSVYVTVWNHPELSKQVAVDADGNVRIPLSGAVAVGGLDENAAAKKVADALRPFVVYPAVNIETTVQGSTLFVSGGPVGVLKYQPGETLEAAIADEMAATNAPPEQALDQTGATLTKVNDTSASIRSRIDLHTVKVERDGKPVGVYDTVALSAHGDAGPVLEPGDQIVFRYKPIEVRVLGDVSQPGLTYLSPDQSITDAISQAGGLLPSSATNHIEFQRDGQTQSLALADPLFSQPAHDGDVVTVPQAPRVTVVGLVMNPGVVSLKSDSTLLSAVYTAGGPARFADLRNVKIVNSNSKTSYDITALTHGDTSQNPTLHDGDTVLVPRSHEINFDPFFAVFGGVAAAITNHIPL